MQVVYIFNIKFVTFYIHPKYEFVPAYVQVVRKQILEKSDFMGCRNQPYKNVHN